VEAVPFNLYGQSQDWIGKWDVTGGQASYLLWNDNVGNLYLSWTTGGTVGHADQRRSPRRPCRGTTADGSLSGPP
jgi:uncharacterized protein (DUF2235 family)